MPFPFAALIPLAISAVSSGIQHVLQRRAAKKESQYNLNANMELAKYQSSANQQYIDKQNFYNSPEMQMQRFGDAGLNPNLIYGQGSSGNQASPNKFEAPTVNRRFDALQLPEMLSNFQDYQMKNAQIDNVKASTESTRAGIATQLLNRMLTSVKTRQGEQALKQGQELFPYNLDVRKHDALLRHHQNQIAMQKLFQEEAKGSNIYERLKQESQLRQGAITARDLDNTFKAYRNTFVKMGINTSDHIAVRMLTRMLSEAGLLQDGFGVPKP